MVINVNNNVNDIWPTEISSTPQERSKHMNDPETKLMNTY